MHSRFDIDIQGQGICDGKGYRGVGLSLERLIFLGFFYTWGNASCRLEHLFLPLHQTIFPS